MFSVSFHVFSKDALELLALRRSDFELLTFGSDDLEMTSSWTVDLEIDLLAVDHVSHYFYRDPSSATEKTNQEESVFVSPNIRRMVFHSGIIINPSGRSVIYRQFLFHTTYTHLIEMADDFSSSQTTGLLACKQSYTAQFPHVRVSRHSFYARYISDITVYDIYNSYYTFLVTAVYNEL
jgi:hypothetical protein